jgi:dephospho-CoA kinase
MLKVAVTGNIGSGKTTICRIFNILGVPVFYADQEAKKLYKDPFVFKQVTDKFGTEILDSEKNISFKALASIIFNKPDALSFINQLIHPRVYELFNQWTTMHVDKPYCIQESALVFETGSNKLFDKVILVQAPEQMLAERVMKRDGSSLEQFKNRLEKQMNQSIKAERSDFVIINDNKSFLIPQVTNIHEMLLGVSTHW